MLERFDKPGRGRPRQFSDRHINMLDSDRAVHRHDRSGLGVQGGLHRQARIEMRLRRRIEQRAPRLRLADRERHDGGDGAVDAVRMSRPCLPIHERMAMLMTMKRLFALLALLALVLAPFAFASGSAATPGQASHCAQSMVANTNRQQSAPHEVNASCCQAAAPAALPAEPVLVAAPVVAPRPSYRSELLAARQSPQLPFEPPPPRNF